ncbi:MAG: phosphatidate cytidylyltransferase [Anaerolineales bacterium]
MLIESGDLARWPISFSPASMLGQRIRLVFIYLPIILVVVWLGGWVYAAGVAWALVLAAVEFGRMYTGSRRKPAIPLIAAGAALLPLARHPFGFESTHILLAVALATSLLWHIIDFERGAEASGTDFAVTAIGIIYFGWLGAFLVSLRDLPHGQWWVLLALPSVWLADIGAYIAGSAFGKRKLSPRVSPNKSVEGYLSGILLATLGGGLLSWLWGQLGDFSHVMTFSTGAALGALLSFLAPLGDLGISMFKRELGVKDTGIMLGPHGGALDRMDTWFWTGLIGYYFALWVTA